MSTMQKSHQRILELQMSWAPEKWLWFASIFLIPIGIVASPVIAQEIDMPCYETLSKKARVVYNKVIEKRVDASDLKELWKEVSRDLITEKKFGREDVTEPAREAYNCLERGQ